MILFGEIDGWDTNFEPVDLKAIPAVGFRIPGNKLELKNGGCLSMTACGGEEQQKRDEKNSFHGMRVVTPNDGKLCDRRSGRGLCRSVVGWRWFEAQAVTAEPVRRSAWMALGEPQ